MGSLEDAIPHALVVPSKGQGHVVGSMLLSESLASLGFKVSFLYFSSYYSRLSQRNRLVLPSPDLRGDDGSNEANNAGRGRISIHVVEDGLLPEEVDKSFFVKPTMKDNLFNLIIQLQQQVPPLLCLISDTFIPWTVEVSERAGIPRIELWTSNAMSHHFLTNFDVLFEEGIFPEKVPCDQWKRDPPLMLKHIPGLPPFSSELIPNEIRFGSPTDHILKYFSKAGACTKSGERLLINTISELEPDAFKAFELQGIPAYGIGPLPTQLKENDQDNTGCLQWLTLQADYSVVYVAFGSMASLSREEIQELAMGLEASGSPFLWVLREDVVKAEELPEVLPEGFLERTCRTGMIIKWAPQATVLAHKAVGCFLSHCGWNSTVESLSAGVPVLCCPRFAEQRLNCYYLCNLWGAGLELNRTDTGGLERTFVEVGVKALMLTEEGHKAGRKAKEMMHLMQRTNQPGGQSFSNLQKLYDDMRALSAKRSLRTSAK